MRTADFCDTTLLGTSSPLPQKLGTVLRSIAAEKTVRLVAWYFKENRLLSFVTQVSSSFNNYEATVEMDDPVIDTATISRDTPCECCKPL